MKTVIIYVRVSHADQASVSAEAQERECAEFCARNGWHVAGVFVDKNVSGWIAPEKRQGMSEALAVLPTVDYLVTTKHDRLGRRNSDLARLKEDHFEAHGAAPVTVDGQMNPTTWRSMFGLFAWMAEQERERIRERTMSTRAEILAQGRVRTIAPFGYRIVRRGGGAFLEIDPDAAELVSELASRVIAGATVEEVVRWLNRHGIDTPRMHAAKRAGRVPKAAKWAGSVVRKMLVSPALRGIRTRWDQSNNVPVECFRPDGSVDVIAPEILDASTWHKVRAAIAERRNPLGFVAKTDSPLSGAVWCGSCGSHMVHGMSRRKGRKDARSYRCKARSCVTINADHLDAFAGEWFAEALGGLKVHRTEVEQGHDVTAELADVERALSGLTAAIEANPGAAAALGARVAELDAKRTALGAEQARPRVIRQVATGETYADVWGRLDGMGRRGMLKAAGVRFEISPGVRGRKGFDPARVAVEISDLAHAEAAERFAFLAHELAA
ncbi:recombinase family protein [Kitasatospora sp. NPDC058184]|uniref:recombinase family protein n=1 Tax=Kitasatospora sp. NPDC058184 TaxID=3346370 RepID=UPI0036DC7020